MLESERVSIAFRIRGKLVRFDLPLPDKKDSLIATTIRRGYRCNRSAAQIEEAYKQAIRQRWRALVLCIKAKLEAVECKITTFEEEFMANIVMADGTTIGEHILPRLDDICATGNMPRLLMGPDKED